MEHRPRAVAAFACTEEQRSVVVNLRIPKLGSQECRVEWQRSGEPVRQIDQMHSLVDQFATPGPARLSTPFSVIAQSSSVAISCAEVHQLAVRAAADLCLQVSQCRVE